MPEAIRRWKRCILDVCQSRLEDPVFMRRFHAIGTIFWIVITPFAVALSIIYRDAIFTLAWLVLVSHYANVMGHWSSWQAVRIEVKQDQQQGGP